MGEPLRIGLVGCGHISAQYLATIDRLDDLTLVAAADLDPARAAAVSDVRPGARACSVEELLTAGDVDVVLNLTLPATHGDLARRAIAAGKDVYGEKPLTATVGEARVVMSEASRAGVRVACAPDTVLGTGLQTARRCIDDGLLGTPLAATATMVAPGHEIWHPHPDFYYVPGGGPLLDMGPYYVTALVTLLGPVTSVIGAGSRMRATRTIGSGPREGELIPVSTDSHVTGVLTHASGVLSTLVMSFDAVATRSANIEVHGDRGSLVVPDPNYFDGEVFLHGIGGGGWEELLVAAGYRDAARGYGLADLARTPAGQNPRCSGDIAFHVLEVLEGVLLAAEQRRSVDIESSVERPAAVPLGSLPGGPLTHH